MVKWRETPPMFAAVRTRPQIMINFLISTLWKATKDRRTESSLMWRFLLHGVFPPNKTHGRRAHRNNDTDIAHGHDRFFFFVFFPAPHFAPRSKHAVRSRTSQRASSPQSLWTCFSTQEPTDADTKTVIFARRSVERRDEHQKSREKEKYKQALPKKETQEARFFICLYCCI